MNTVLLKEYSEVLTYYVEHVTERELQLLFAVEELVTLRQQPKGKPYILLNEEMFNFLILIFHRPYSGNL